MVRPVQAEEGVGAALAQLVTQRAGPQVGLLVGKHAVGSRDLLLGLIRSPAQDGQDALQASSSGQQAQPSPSSKAGSRSGKKKAGGGGGGCSATPGAALSLSLDVEWVAEHAAQVARMLPGGLAVLGLYISCSDPSYQGAAAQLCAALAAVAARTAASEDLLLLHADSGSRKLTLRSLAVPQGSPAVAGQPRVAELKLASSAGSLVCLRCSHSLDLALPTPSACSQLQQQLEGVVDAACAAISK